MVPGGLQSFAVDAPFAGFVLLEQAEGETVEHGEVPRGVTGAFAAEIFAAGRIQHPAQFVFDAPVLADELMQPRGVGREACHVRTGLPLRFAGGFMESLGPDAEQRLKVWCAGIPPGNRRNLFSPSRLAWP